MSLQRVGWMALILFAGLALWLLLAGPGHLFGLRTDGYGVYFLIAAAWALLYAVSRIPRESVEHSASLAEWHAWIGMGFKAVAMAYFFSKMHVLNDAPLLQNADAGVIGRNLVLLLVAWGATSHVLTSRWKNVVEQDERDREVATKAANWGRGALIVSIVGIAVTLSLTPQARLDWATPPMIGSMLIFALMWGWFCEYVATLAMYWRDRTQNT
jgi:hypothetical protein